jgi:alpha-L-fucosidase 2
MNGAKGATSSVRFQVDDVTPARSRVRPPWPSTLVCGALLLLIQIDLPVFARSSTPVDAYNVVWDSPSADHHGSMPLGNGDIALNAWFTKAGDLQFYIAKTDAWDDNARLVKVGKVRVHFEPNPVVSGQAFRQELRLSEGCLEVSIGEARAKSTIRLWVDANHPVIHITAQASSPIQATAFVELWRTNQHELAEVQCSDVMNEPGKPQNKHAPTILEPDTVLAGQRDRIGWFHHNVKSVGPRMLAEVQGLTGFAQTDPLLHRTFGAVVTARKGERMNDTSLLSPASTSHQFSIYVLTSHPSTAERWLDEMDETIRRVESRSFTARLRAHQVWWREFWGRSWIRASADANAERPGSSPVNEPVWVSQMYHLQRFVTACAGRGAYPIKFNGSLFTVPPGPTEDDPDYRRWGPGYWWQNTRLPYISLCTSGDFDLQQPLFKMYAEQLLPLAKYRTKLYLGHEGAYYPECIMFWGAVFSETYGWTPFERRQDKLQESGWHKWEWVGGLELTWMMLDYFEHTLDRHFLQHTALPFAHEILTFFDQHYSTNAEGKLVMHPSQALETWWRCTNAAPELAGCFAVSERLLGLPRELAPAGDRELWLRLRSKLPPIPTREVSGRKALAPAEFFAEKNNIENPELYAVFPFRLFAFNRPSADWALAAFEHRWDRGNSGWRQDDIFMAYLSLTDQVREAMVSRARSHDAGERFPAFWGPNYDWTPDQDHGSVLMKTLQAMLLQTDGRKIFLLPAWPKEWDVEFRLHAPQQTVIEGSYHQGKLDRLQVTPRSRRQDLVISGR